MTLISNPETLLEGVFGLGVDIIEIERFRHLNIESHFFRNVFTSKELAYCSKYPDPSPHLAAIFAGKEATLKAMSKEVPLSMRAIEIHHNENSIPSATIHGLPEVEIFLSLAHSEDYAAAIALAIPFSQTAKTLSFQKLLDNKISELLPKR
jgi:holo-[acyl-carrier protein] synthase